MVNPRLRKPQQPIRIFEDRVVQDKGKDLMLVIDIQSLVALASQIVLLLLIINPWGLVLHLKLLWIRVRILA